MAFGDRYFSARLGEESGPWAFFVACAVTAGLWLAIGSPGLPVEAVVVVVAP